MAEKSEYTPRLKSHYRNVVRQSLIDAFKYDNPMAVPRLEKVVINVGIGEAVGDSRRSPWCAKSLPRSPARSRW